MPTKTMRKRLLATAALAGLMGSLLGATDNPPPSTPPTRDHSEPLDSESHSPTTSRLPTAVASAERRQALAAQLREVWNWPEVLDQPEKLDAYAPRVIPLVGELAEVEKLAAEQEPATASGPLGVRDQLLALGALLGDKKAIEELAASARAADPAERSAAEAADLLSRWWRAGLDADAQSKVLDRMADLLRGPGAASDRVTGILFAMCDRAATPGIPARVKEIVVSIRPPGPRAAAYLEIWHKERQTQQRDLEQAALMVNVGKPITLGGTTFGGHQLTTADWKGRVVLVDFWATWCGPCVQSLPDVNQTYEKYHGCGLEVVGVCCDRERDRVEKFRAAHPFMRWPDLLEPGHEGDLHPLAIRFGVHGIPSYFLIDKKGVLRKIMVGAGEMAKDDTKATIEQLLNEP